MQHKFSEKARKQMMEAMSNKSPDRKTKASRPPRDYHEEFLQAQHVSTDGWVGIPCVAFRAAMIDACRAVNLVMTRAKLALFVVPDGFGTDGTPLVRITEGEPEKHEGLVRLETGVADIRVRPMWKEWGALVTLRFDADMISRDAVVNLLMRAGLQVGIQEGRDYSKNSVGQGWGSFEIDTLKPVKTFTPDKTEVA